MEQSNVSQPKTRWQRIRDTYYRELFPLLYNRAAWFFCIVWLASLCYVFLRGKAGSFIGTLLFDLIILVLTILTIFFTYPPEPLEQAEITNTKQRLWVQITAILLFILFIGYYGMIVNKVLSPPQPLASFLYNTPLYIITLVFYFVLPMSILLLLKVRWRDVGFGHGSHVWRVIALWAVLPLTSIIALTVTKGWGVLPLVIKQMVMLLFTAGFVEEFLFRGALLSRLRLLLGTSWAIVLSSLVFGLWHLGTNLVNDAGGEYLAALAFGIFSQAFLGLCLSVVFLRTRNLIAPSIVHVLIDFMGSLF